MSKILVWVAVEELRAERGTKMWGVCWGDEKENVQCGKWTVPGPCAIKGIDGPDGRGGWGGAEALPTRSALLASARSSPTPGDTMWPTYLAAARCPDARAMCADVLASRRRMRRGLMTWWCPGYTRFRGRVDGAFASLGVRWRVLCD
jgi:hypothetical protein